MIRGKKLSEQAANRINIDVKMDIHNRFDVEVVDVRTGEVRQRAVGYNVICNQLWTKLLTPAAYFNYIHYGTGTGTPIAADNSLFRFFGYGAVSADNETRTYNENTGIGSLRRSIQLAPETAAGATITEVGIAHGTASNTLCTHAMLQDMNGNPISIIKTDRDVINIYATVYCHFDPNGYMNGSVFFGGCSWNVAFMKSICGGYSSNGWPNAAFASRAWGMVRAGISSDTVSVTKAYDVANKRMTLTLGRFGVNVINHPLSEIMVFGYNYTGGSYGGEASGPCVQLIPGVEGGWFPPYRIEGEALGTGDGEKTVFNTAFPFATNPTVYVDGVEVTEGVTVGSVLNTCKYPAMYMRSIKSTSRLNHIIPSTQDIFTYKYEYDTSSPGGAYVPVGGWTYFYNPAYEQTGITKISCGDYCMIETSPDNENWTRLSDGSKTGTTTIASQYQKNPFWRIWCVSTTSHSGSVMYYHYTSFTLDATGGNVTFDEPPAIGSVITIDYTTPTVPKDANHVLDITITVQFGEYAED